MFMGLDPQDAIDEWLAHNWAQEAESFVVEVEGAAIACRGWNLAATHLPGIVLVHGYRANARWWDHIAPSLAETHRVVAVNLSGMGDSGRREAYSRLGYARELLAVADQCGFRPVTLIAHSFGGTCAVLASRMAPEAVERLVVIDTALPTPSDDDRQIPVLPPRVYPDAETAMSRYRLLPPGLWPQPAVMDYIAAHSVCADLGGWTWKFDETLAETLNRDDHHPHMYGVTVPVDVIYGDRTEVMTPERRAEIYRMASNVGQLIAIPVCHHHVLIEQPIALVSALRALLANPRT